MIFNQGCNIVGIKKDINYVMTCAWAMQADDNKCALLLGSQSVTSKNILEGDIIGISVLAKGQEKIAATLGNFHSNETDKLKNIEHYYQDSAILIKDAKVNIVGKVIKILDLFNNGDKLVCVEFIDLVESELEILNYINI